MHYRYLQARVHEQETSFLFVNECQFLIRERVLVNPDNARAKRAVNVFNIQVFLNLTN